MPKSELFKYYSDKLSRVKTPDELLALTREIARQSFRSDEQLALTIACMFIAKKFDKLAAKQKVGVTDETSSLDCCSEV